MSLLEDVSLELKNNSLVENVELVDNGHVKIVTRFIRHNGNKINVFVDKNEDRWFLSDFAESDIPLLIVTLDPFNYKKTKSLLHSLKELYEVDLRMGDLFCRKDNLTEGIICLVQGCLWISAVISTLDLHVERN